MIKFKNSNFVNYDILIGLHLNTTCNLNCKYCYAKNMYKNIWNKNKEFNTEQINKIILLFNTISKNKKLFITLLGGEPILSKNLDKIIQNVKNTNFRIFTNFLSNPEKVLYLYNQGIHFVISFHKQYQIKILENILKYYDKIPNRKYKPFIDLMIDETTNYEKYLDVFQKLQEKFIFRIEVINTFKTITEYIENIKINFLKHKKLFKFINIDFNHIKKFQYIYNNNVKCDLKEFDLNFYGDLKKACDSKSINIFKTEIEDIISFLVTKPYFCKKNKTCLCNDLLINNFLKD